MSAPGPSMLQKRLYNVLPRVQPAAVVAAAASASTSRARSGSASRSFYSAPSSTVSASFFDAPPPPPRSPIITANRLPIEAKGEAEAPAHHVPKPLAFGPSNPSTSSSPYPFSTSPSLFSYQTHPFAAPTHWEPTQTKADEGRKRPRLKYQLDVGAYGIPKKERATSRKVCEDAVMAVQVGEDAYFVRDNAMGVADGVGGWARTKHPDALRPALKMASPSAAFARRLMHYCSTETAAAASVSHAPCPVTAPLPTHTPWHWPRPVLEEALEDELDELSDGIDVLMILQRAYDQTLKAHVAPPTPSSSPPKSSLFSKGSSTPLGVGSSTALLAILDQSPHTTACASTSGEMDAVIKIAHIGDCMGMLVRGDDIVWRSDEMWWGFNAPVQLGPSSHARPSDAQVFTFPVREDDILILASDGLSDNLWDEDVLDEVVRFRRSYLAQPTGDKVLQRRTLAGMLSEALCSRARNVSRRHAEEDVPFARRAREEGRAFRGGKMDDISVVVAVISPVEPESTEDSLL